MREPIRPVENFLQLDSLVAEVNAVEDPAFNKQAIEQTCIKIGDLCYQCRAAFYSMFLREQVTLAQPNKAVGRTVWKTDENNEYAFREGVNLAHLERLKRLLGDLFRQLEVKAVRNINFWNGIHQEEPIDHDILGYGNRQTIAELYWYLEERIKRGHTDPAKHVIVPDHGLEL